MCFQKMRTHPKRMNYSVVEKNNGAVVQRTVNTSLFDILPVYTGYALLA